MSSSGTSSPTQGNEDVQQLANVPEIPTLNRSPPRTAWNMLPKEIQYQIVMDLEDHKTQKYISEKYNIGYKTIVKLKKKSLLIKYQYWYRFSDPITPIVTTNTAPKAKKRQALDTSDDGTSEYNKLRKGETQNLDQKSTDNGSSHDEQIESSPSMMLRPSGRRADWDDFLSNIENLDYVAPVQAFRYAPLGDMWQDISLPGRTFEVPNPFVRCKRPVYWFASTVAFAGYNALIEFESLGSAKKYFSWMSFCGSIPKPIGYSVSNSILLHPPYEIRAEFPDDYFSRALDAVNARHLTLQPTHGDTIANRMKKYKKFQLGTILEVLDRTDLSRMRLGKVTATIGDRIHVTYLIEPMENDRGFWFNVNSELVKPVGWSRMVGQKSYGIPSSTQFQALGPEHFPLYPKEIRLTEGQLLEVRHPACPVLICAGVICTVLHHGYLVVQIQVLPAEILIPTRFTFHVTSPYIFECGFCANHGIDIMPPFGETPELFSWANFMSKRNLTKAPLGLLPQRARPQFKVGMKLEAVDVTCPTNLYPATIIRIEGHLLLLHYDGWRRYCKIDRAEVWVDAESPDIYPVGYAEMVGHEIQGCVEPTHPDDKANQLPD